MDKETDNKENTLKIGASKLKLNNSVGSRGANKSNNKVTVVMKKRVVNRDVKPSYNNSEIKKDLSKFKLGGLTEQERNARLNAIKNLETSSSIFESKSLIMPKHIEEPVVKKEEIKKTSEAPKPVITEISELKEKNLKQDTAYSVKKEKINKDDKIEIADKDELDDNKNKKAEVKIIKTKVDKARRVSGKINVNSILDDETEAGSKVRSLSSIRRAREKAKNKIDQSKLEKVSREIIVPDVITVQELSNRMFERAADVVKELMKLGVIANTTHEIDADTAEIIIETFGHKMKRVSDSDVEKILENLEEGSATLERRAPVVTIMGHVDHGKTSLLDALRSTDVVSGEAGGITQHIGAYRIKLESGEFITFIDTPGHEAFTAMRARGAKSTDIVVLVVAADDGIMEQTKEAINHAKAANVPIIVAVNKIDKPEANPEKIRTELLQYDLVPEEFGGDIMVVDVSAKAKLNLDKLEEIILLQAEMLDLKANNEAVASGVVIESRIDKNQGVLCTFLVQRGTLKAGDIVVAGEGYGKVKKMMDDKANLVTLALPSVPVEILGLDAAPDAGEKFNVVTTEKQAREIVEYRNRTAKFTKSVAIKKGSSLEDLFARSGSASKIKELAMIIKCDVQGSVEAIIGSFTKFENAEVKIKVLHTGVGGITKSDVILANASNALIIGFNVRANNQAVAEASLYNVDIRYYSIIYNLVDDVKAIVTGMLSPIIREEYTGKAIIQQVFNITKVGKIAGCMVIDGVLKKDSNIRLLRDNVVIYEGKLKKLKRFKDDVKEVKNAQECGISIQN
jgi:translation initiation factor IF-2